MKNQQENDLDECDLNAFLREDLMAFLERCFIELNPTLELSDAPHLHVMTTKLADCLLGHGRKRLIINLPPRSLKSITVSVAAVAWLLGHDPTKQLICASYGQDLAEKHARDTRTIMMSSFYRALFPATRLSAHKLSVNDFSTTAHGFRMATSVGGVLTGRGGDVLILDDVLKPDDALSETKRTGVNDWYDNTLLSRLNNKEEGRIIIVMQRLHQDDLIGHVLENGEAWDVLSFPAIAEADQRYILDTPTGPFEYKRKAGEVLDPGRESLATLLTIKQQIGGYNFASQYQQDPTSREGGVIKREWIKYYDPDKLPKGIWYILQSWDTASKIDESNDFSVCTTWGVSDEGFYLLHVYRKRLTFPELKRAVVENFNKFAVSQILIEDKASGISLLQELGAEGIFSIEPYKPQPGRDKYVRLADQSIKFESGKVFLPQHASWLEEYLREITSFPGSKYDDQVDSTSQALEVLTPWTPAGKPCRWPFGPRGYETC